MARVLRNIGAVLAGVVVGSVVNMALVHAGGVLAPAPAGADVTSMEGLQASMHLFGPMNFLFPFLAHALGTLVGAATAAAIAVGPKRLCGFIVGGFFLAGGIAAVVLLPAPLWFEALDLVAAYLPMAWLGGWLVTRKRDVTNA